MAHKEKNNRQERGFLRKTKEVKMNRITINGKTITCSGTNVVISNGKVIVDGKTIQECNSGDSELLRLIEVGASCFNHYCAGYDDT